MSDLNEPDESASNLMALSEMVAPHIEWAEGQRAKLIGRGWSPAAAEQYALELLLSLTRTAFKAIKT